MALSLLACHTLLDRLGLVLFASWSLLLPSYFTKPPCSPKILPSYGYLRSTSLRFPRNFSFTRSTSASLNRPLIVPCFTLRPLFLLFYYVPFPSFFTPPSQAFPLKTFLKLFNLVFRFRSVSSNSHIYINLFQFPFFK